ncbi:heme-binding protein [Oceanisphaera sp. IT1-181]|uniref:SOUL family heme-binding protein n=1 Tax=Oceanisphaera sp. IT1-181 TaxID=3081199 RepID=UPI0029CA67CB|nr:heme-binding protein [Oceanisphaera sp. IT1-181]
MASEEAKFTVLLKYGSFEVREYAPHVVAKTWVEGEFSNIGRQAFGRLFKYISGHNHYLQKIPMTSPVVQQAENQHSESQPVNGIWQVSFMMPAGSRLDTLPVPKDHHVLLQPVSAQKMAAVRYSGSWSEQAYLEHKQSLQAWLQTQVYQTTGEAMWARYNPPFTLWFLRRNEVLIPITRLCE